MNEWTPVALCNMITDAKPMAISRFITVTNLTVVTRKLVVGFTTVKLSMRPCVSSQWWEAERPAGC